MVGILCKRTAGKCTHTHTRQESLQNIQTIRRIGNKTVSKQIMFTECNIRPGASDHIAKQYKRYGIKLILVRA